MRLDQSVQQLLSCSRNEAMRLVAAGCVRVNGRVCEDKGRMLAETDHVEADGGQAQTVVPQPELELAILARGEGWIVADKPAGMPVHPLVPGETGTVLNAVVACFPEIQGVGEEGGLRSGVVHRLDVETSGCLAFALTDEAWRKLRRAFADHTIRKTYLAEVSGRLEDDGKAALDLFVKRHSPAFVAAADPADAAQTKRARRCTLAWKVLEKKRHSTVVEVDLGTGFLHQIRATFAHLGHPLVGDAHYGGPPADRLKLHAWRLVFDGAGMQAQSACPFVP